MLVGSFPCAYDPRMRNTLFAETLLVVMLPGLCASVYAGEGRLQALIKGEAVAPSRVLSIAVDGDTITGVDSATITLEGNSRFRPASVGEALQVAGINDGVTTTIFKGEIVSVEPVFDASGESKIVVRGYDRLYRLTRQRHSRVYENMSDAEIAADIARQAGLAFGPSGPEAAVENDRVFQRNQTDLDFLRARASRIGYAVFVEDMTLYFQRRLDSLPISLGCTPARTGASAVLKVFHPRLAASRSVSKVTVRGWDPAHHEEIDATATRRLIPLSRGGMEITEPPGTPFDAGFVQAIDSGVVLHAAAFGMLAARTAEDLSGEADADGNPFLRPGALVEIDHAGDTFNGQYHVAGVSHRFDRDRKDGWHTLLRMVRADRGVYLLPEVGDEVLIAFEHGDIAHPVVVGSLWDSEPPPTEDRPCDIGGIRR